MWSRRAGIEGVFCQQRRPRDLQPTGVDRGFVRGSKFTELTLTVLRTDTDWIIQQLLSYPLQLNGINLKFSTTVGDFDRVGACAQGKLNRGFTGLIFTLDEL